MFQYFFGKNEMYCESIGVLFSHYVFQSNSWIREKETATNALIYSNLFINTSYFHPQQRMSIFAGILYVMVLPPPPNRTFNAPSEFGMI